MKKIKREEIKVADGGVTILKIGMAILMLASIFTVTTSPVVAQGLVVGPGVIFPGFAAVYAIFGMTGLLLGAVSCFIACVMYAKLLGTSGQQSKRKGMIDPSRKQITTAKGGPALVLTIAFALLCTTPSSVAATTPAIVDIGTAQIMAICMAAALMISTIVIAITQSIRQSVRTVSVDLMKTKGAKTGKPALVLVAIIGITAFLTPTCAALGLPVPIAISPTILLGICVTVMAVALVLKIKEPKGTGPPSTSGEQYRPISAITGLQRFVL